MAGIERRGEKLVLLLRGGGRLVLGAPFKNGEVERSHPDEPLAPSVVVGLAVIERVENALAARRGSTEGARALPGLHAPRDDIGKWMARLRAVARGEGGSYREPALAPDVLWRIVEDGASAPRTRIGAAVALAAAGDEETTSRLTRVAELTASPSLRVAIEAAAQSEDAHLMAALEDIDDEATARR